MWIKLISPRVTMRPMDSAWKTRMSPPLSLAVLAALTPGEHKITIEDENIEAPHIDEQPDMVGITVKVDTMQRACEISALYRSQGIPVVMGGIHPTVTPESCMDHADAVVIGEAENLWPKVIDDMERHRLKPVYRDNQPVDIATVPTPEWSLLKGKKYLFTNTITISRGCPWRCDFCYNSSDNINASYRMKPIRNILREIKSLNTDHVMFIDDNFIGNIDQTRRLLIEMSKLNLTWHAAVSADIGKHDDIIDLMAESGCKSLFIGFESVNQNNLLNCHKPQNKISQYDDTISKLHQRGILVNASLVFGFDEDDESVFPLTLDWLVRNKISTMTAHILTPYPGTKLYKRLQAEGRIIDYDLDHYNTAHTVFLPAKMSCLELEDGYLDMYSKFYSWENILKRFPVANNQIVAYLQFNLLYRKFGKATSWLGKQFGMRPMAEFARNIAYPKRKHQESRNACPAWNM